MNSHFIGRIGKDGAKVIEGKNGKFLSMDVATDYYSRGKTKHCGYGCVAKFLDMSRDWHRILPRVA